MRIHPTWPTWTRDLWPENSLPASCERRRCSRCSKCSTSFSASLSPFHKSPVFSWRSPWHYKPCYQLLRSGRLVLHCGGFQSCEEGWLVGAIDGRRLPSNCALAPQRNSTRGGNFRRGKVPDYEAGWRTCVYVRTSPRWMSLDGICSGFRRASACPATLNTSRWTEKNEACSWTRKCSMMIHVKYRISETDAHSLTRYLPIFQSGFHSFSSIKPLI